MTDRIHIEDVGPIRELDIPLPPGGGVIVLHGLNGLGKSTAIDAAARLAGSGSAKLTHRDGAPAGSVEGLGATIAVRATTRRTGEAVLGASQIVSDVNPAGLVDPGLKSAEAADRARVKHLLEITGTRDTREDWIDHVGEEVYSGAIAPDEETGLSPVDRCDRLKRALEAEARKAEKEAEQHAGAADSLQRDVSSALDGMTEAEFRAIPHDADALRAAHTAAVRALAEAEGSADARARHRAMVEEARARLSQLQGTVPSTEQDTARLDAARTAEQNAADLVRRLEQELGDAKLEAQRAEDRRVTAEEAAAQHAAQRNELAELRATVDTPEPEAPDVASLQAAADAAERAVERGGVVRRALPRLEELARETDAARASKRRADDYRNTARATDVVLSRLVAQAGVPGLRIEGGRLVAEKEGRPLTYFADLSTGERWRLALPLALRAIGRGGLLSVDQAAWEALDPPNRDHIAAEAKSAGVWLITAEATDGPLRAEPFDAE